ncbi:hypothetical protein N2W52_002068 [Clostridium perfringens]|nr:hypothetical protein [Clostridium perfringens]MDK0983085.1 hypothetical protein [Clostridium perfringens]
MKSKSEILKEIELTKRTIKNYKEAYKNGKISKDILEYNLIDCKATLEALSWVLEENDRWD